VLAHKEPGKQPTLSDYLDHFEYIAELVGTDHIGIGSDVYESYSKFSWETSTKLFYPSPWTYETMLSEGFTRIDQIEDVIRGLVARGFSDEDIRKILGENFLRVFRVVWRDDF
jgi:membrane dipeptidase